jgi:hypothetical protein
MKLVYGWKCAIQFVPNSILFDLNENNVGIRECLLKNTPPT